MDINVSPECESDRKRNTLVARCLEAFNTCLSRFPHHYKSLYRAAKYYHTARNSKSRDNNRSRGYLVGSLQAGLSGTVSGLFYERKVYYQQAKNCNMFHGVWRIPSDEIDRPGSFAAHMYRCVSLALDVLPSVKDFITTLDIALALKTTPDKDKKYLRESERKLLCEHASQVALQTIKDKHRILFKTNAVVNRNRRIGFLMDVFRCFRFHSKHLPSTEAALSSIVGQSFAGIESIAGQDPATLLRRAEAFCSQNGGLSIPPRAAQAPVIQFNPCSGRLKRLATAMAANRLPNDNKLSHCDPLQVNEDNVQNVTVADNVQNNQNIMQNKASADDRPVVVASEAACGKAPDGVKQSFKSQKLSSSVSDVSKKSTHVGNKSVPSSSKSVASSSKSVPSSSASLTSVRSKASVNQTSKNKSMPSNKLRSPVKTAQISDKDMASIQEAYKVYDTLIRCQTQIKNQNLDPPTIKSLKSQSEVNHSNHSGLNIFI